MRNRNLVAELVAAIVGFFSPYPITGIRLRAFHFSTDACPDCGADSPHELAVLCEACGADHVEEIRDLLRLYPYDSEMWP